MTLYNELLDQFAQGAVRYSDHYLDEPQNRIVISVQLENSKFVIPVIVDTGAPWPILNPEIADEIGIDYKSEQEWPTAMWIRGQRYEGWLCRITISLVAEEGCGSTLELEATVFIPKMISDDRWQHPNFLGLDGLLNRIRFAVDPSNNLFYFGTEI